MGECELTKLVPNHLDKLLIKINCLSTEGFLIKSKININSLILPKLGKLVYHNTKLTKLV